LKGEIHDEAVTHQNKSLDSIVYNVLNLPQQITISTDGNNEINYLYTVNGQKLMKQTRTDFAVEQTIDYVGNFVYEDNVLKYILTSEGRVLANSGGNFEYQYSLKDHLGNTRITFNQNGEIIQEDAYYPFGMKMNGLCYQSGIDYENKYLYNGKEFQDDFGLDWYDYGARMYDAVIGRWHVIDPLIEKHHEYTPYAYVYNNPILFIDPDGRDSAQRAAAVTKAEEYVKKNSGDTYPTAQDKTDGKFRGKPGEKVDCSGMVDNCIVAGEEPSSKNNGEDNGVKNVTAQSDKVGDKDDLSKAIEGNAVTLNNTFTEPLDSKRDLKHIGIISKIERDDNGNVTTLQIIHSSGKPGSGSSGPRYDYAIKGGKAQYWGKRITGVYKWDKKPDK
jgi:RHS repeat-associated protein